MNTYVALISALVLIAIAIAVLRFRRGGEPRKRKRPSAGGFAWALMFLGGGRMPPPPPQSQIEQEAGEKKNREISRDAVDLSAESREMAAARIRGDRDVIAALADSKSNLAKPHEIEFHFIGYDESKLAALAQEGKSLGYRVSSIDTLVDEGGAKYWYFDLIQAVVPAEENIIAQTAIMVALARKFGAEYDGWGCNVVD